MLIPFGILYANFCNAYPMATKKNLYCPAIYIESWLTSMLVIDRSLEERVVPYSPSFSTLELKKSISARVYSTFHFSSYF